MIHDYESIWRWPNSDRPPLLEFYTGTQVVRWWGNIERQLKEKVAKYEAQQNQVYVDKLRAFAKVWKEHELTGSINRETVDALKSAASVVADDPWSEGNYFSNLTSSLAVLMASEEQLPRTDEPPGQMGGGGGGGGGGMPAAGGPPPGGFGPEDEETPPSENPANPEPEPEQDPEAELPDEGGQRPSVRRSVAAAIQQAQQ